MKKLFLAFMLLTGFVLASCGTNEYSTKSGDISFTIPVAQLANYTARTGSDEMEYEYTFIVQIEGSKGYYDYKTEKVTCKVDDIMDFTGLQNIPFKFDKLPVNQKYKLFVDIIHQQLTEVSEATNGHGADNSRYILLSGQTEDVAVSANATSPVSVDLLLGRDALSPFALEITYPNSTVEKRNMSEFVKYDGAASFISNVNGKLYVGASGGNGKEVSSIKFVFDDNSHFKHGGTFSFISEGFNADGTSKGPVEVKAQNGAIDLTSELKELDYEIFAKSIKVSLNNIDFDDSVHMHIGKQTYSYLQNYTDVNFIKEEVLNDEQLVLMYRYRATIPLEDLLGDQTFANADTLVFVMNGLSPKGSHTNDVSIDKLNYKFQKSGWEALSPAEKDADIATLSVQDLSDSFIIPVNYASGKEKYLQLHFDVDLNQGIDDSQLEYGAYFNCIKFDASEKVYVFRSEYREDKIRYEMNVKINDVVGNEDHHSGDKLVVTLYGKMSWSPLPGGSTLDNDISLESEYYDNVDVVDCDVNGHGYYYHTLSNSSSNNSSERPKHVTNGGSISPFIFADVLASHTLGDGNHDYRFQCYYECDKDEKCLLIISGYNYESSYLEY